MRLFLRLVPLNAGVVPLTLNFNGTGITDGLRTLDLGGPIAYCFSHPLFPLLSILILRDLERINGTNGTTLESVNDTDWLQVVPLNWIFGETNGTTPI